jgi:hypothetical protein
LLQHLEMVNQLTLLLLNHLLLSLMIYRFNNKYY